MQISLGATNPMWFLLSRGLNLSISAPGPLEVDWASLSTEEKKQILYGLQWGHIKTDLTTEAIAKITLDVSARASELEKVAAPVVATTPNKPTEPYITIDGAVLIPEKVILFPNKRLRIVVEELNTGDLRFLRHMLELEAKGKKRSKVLGILHKKLEALQAEVVSEVKKADGDPVELPPSTKAAFTESPQVSPITEEVISTVTISRN